MSGLDLSVPETKVKPSKKISKAKSSKDLRTLITNLQKEIDKIKKSLIAKIIPKKNSAKFIQFLRKKFDIQNISKADMRVIKKLPNSMNYEQKQTLSGLVRHLGNIDLVLEWVHEFLSES